VTLIRSTASPFVRSSGPRRWCSRFRYRAKRNMRTIGHDPPMRSRGCARRHLSRTAQLRRALARSRRVHRAGRPDARFRADPSVAAFVNAPLFSTLPYRMYGRTVFGSGDVPRYQLMLVPGPRSQGLAIAVPGRPVASRTSRLRQFRADERASLARNRHGRPARLWRRRARPGGRHDRPPLSELCLSWNDMPIILARQRERQGKTSSCEFGNS